MHNAEAPRQLHLPGNALGDTASLAMSSQLNAGAHQHATLLAQDSAGRSSTAGLKIPADFFRFKAASSCDSCA